MATKPLTIDPKDLAQLAEAPVPLRRVVALFRPFGGQLALVTAIILVSSVVALGQPLLIRATIDQALPLHNTTLLIVCVIGMVAVAAASGALGVWQTWIATSLGQQLMHSMRTRVFEHLQRQSVQFFKQTRGGEIQSRLTNDISGMQSVISSTATNVASNLTTTVATFVAMAALNWRFTLLSMAVLPPAALLTRRVAIVRRRVTAQRQKAMADLLSQVEESLTVSGAALVKTLGAGPGRAAEFQRISGALAELELKSRMAGRWRMATMNLVFAALPALIYLAAGFDATSGGMTIGTLIAFTTLQVTVFRPLMGLFNIGAEWIASLALLSRIFGYLDLPIDVPEPVRPGPVLEGAWRGEVVFDKVNYRYPDGDAPALIDIDLRLTPGTSLAIVGETGSGKSTLGALAARLADPTAGRVLVDGVDLRDIPAVTLRKVIGVVSQDPYLLHASLRRNLQEAKPDATDEEMWAALAAAQVDRVIRSLPEGLDTIVGARGHRFSGGERQRLSIARTLLRNPRVLVLDEATSALDQETERELQLALDRLIVGRTTITIAHRLSTIRDADCIAVMSAGRIVERGTHAELMELDGLYARLNHQQDRAAFESTAVLAFPSTAHGRRFLLPTLATANGALDPAG